VILSEAIDMDLSRWPVAARAAVNVGYVAGCVAVMLVLVVSLIGT